MVFDLITGVIVGTDFISPHSQADFVTGRAGSSQALVFLHLPEFGPKKVQSDFPVLLLRAFLADGEG